MYTGRDFYTAGDACIQVGISIQLEMHVYR